MNKHGSTNGAQRRSHCRPSVGVGRGDRRIIYRELLRSVVEVHVVVRERCKLGRLRNDLSRAQPIPLCFQHVDLGCTTSDRIGWAWVLLSRTGTGSEKRSHDVIRNLIVYEEPEQTYDNFWPGSHESSLLYLALDISECKAAAGPEWFAYVWFGNVPTSHESYLPLLRETLGRGYTFWNSRVRPHPLRRCGVSRPPQITHGPYSGPLRHPHQQRGEPMTMEEEKRT